MIDVWTAADPWPNDTRELLLIGPPGTGKTRNVLDAYVWPALRAGQTVLATSYTRAAAEELRKRTSKELGLPPATYKDELSTLHSEASRRVRHLKFKMGPDVAEGAPTEEDESEDRDVGICARIEEEATRGGLAAWDRTRNMYPEDIGLPVEARLRRLPNMYGSQLDDAVVAVERDLHRRHRDGVLTAPDFTTLLEQALVHGEDRRLDLLCVDEAQDLCPLQWALVDKWARSAERILIVGDPDQSIYVWSGADGARLLSWIRAGRCTRRLAQSYRVPAAAYRFARRVIAQVVDREDAPYHPKVDKDTGAVVEGTVREAYGDEAWFVVGAAQEAGDPSFVLSRTNAGCATGTDDLERLHIPYLAERGPSLLGRPGVPPKASKTLSVVLALQEVAHGQDVHPEGARRLVEALSTKGLESLPHGAKSALGQIVRGKRSRVKLDDLEDAGFPSAELVDLWRVLTGAAGSRRDPTKEAARCFIASGGVSAPDVVLVARWVVVYGDNLLRLANLVRVTTCHGSKGREAKVVLIDARHRFRGRQTPEQIDEDRRVLYVAATRTERDLVVLRTNDGEDWLSMHGLRVG